MKKRFRKSNASQRPAMFTSRPGPEGGADKLQVVDWAGRIVAAVPYWYNQAEAQHYADQFVEALHTFYFSGGYFPR